MLKKTDGNIFKRPVRSDFLRIFNFCFDIRNQHLKMHQKMVGNETFDKSCKTGHPIVSAPISFWAWECCHLCTRFYSSNGWMIWLFWLPFDFYPFLPSDIWLFAFDIFFGFLLFDFYLFWLFVALTFSFDFLLFWLLAILTFCHFTFWLLTFSLFDFPPFDFLSFEFLSFDFLSFDLLSWYLVFLHFSMVAGLS